MSIEVKNLFKYYGDQAAVKDVSFTAKSGEILGFLGPNGAGKSTTMKIITGYISASSGEVSVCGMPVNVETMNTRQIIGYLPEHNPLYLDMYVKEYLTFVGKIYKVNDVNDRVADMIKKVGLEVEQKKKIGALSKGYRQRVGLAQAIIHDPKVLILDEPTSGLDPNQLAEIRELIKTIGKEKTVMLSTHIMQEVEAICDRVIIINKGEIVVDNSVKDLDSGNKTHTVYVEFEGEVSLNKLKEIEGVNQVKSTKYGWLLSTNTLIDLRKEVARFAQKNDVLAVTLRKEEKTLEEVFKDLTTK